MKKVLSVVLILCMLFSLCTFVSAGAETEDAGISFSTDDIYNTYGSDIYYTSERLAAVPHTFEAWICMPDTRDSASSSNTVFGNFAPVTTACINFAIRNGKPRLFVEDDMNNRIDILFEEADNLNTGNWEHVALSYDEEKAEIRCYINGELVQTVYHVPTLDPRIVDMRFALGGDYRNLNTDYFRGNIKEFAAYADARTSKEIKADMEKVDTADPDLLVAYDLSAENANQDIEDRSANGNDLLYNKLWLTEEEMEELRDPDFERAYSFAVIGDTQYICQQQPEDMKKMYQWIAENKESKNIQYVIGLGDITNRDTAIEWVNAKEAITQLDGIVDYSLVRGNHDLVEGGSAFNAAFADHQPYAGRFTGENGGCYEAGSMNNTWQAVTIGEHQYLFINLDYGAEDAILQWAGDIIEAHPNHKVIISTHGYLQVTGYHWDDSDDTPATNRGSQYNNGDNMWEELASQYENVLMVLSGHVYHDNIVMTQRKGVHGNTVTEMLIDPQDVDKVISNGHGSSVGAVAMFYFSEDGSQMEVEYYSTIQDRYIRNINQFTVDFNLEDTTENPDGIWNGTALKPEGSGTKSNPYLVESAGNLLWMSKQVKSSSSASLKGVYFKQTCDIDLGGASISSIGVSYTRSTSMQAFGGVYDGNGYSIKNGTIVGIGKVSMSTTATNYSRVYGYGLFGAIYGATIENIVLDNITVIGQGVTGAIVGKASAPASGGTSIFNLISNCKVKENCRIITHIPYAETVSNTAYDGLYRAGMVGSICGIARSTTIQNCTSGVEFEVSGEFSIAGGIAAAAGYNSVIDHCIFNGGINLVDNAALAEASIGGIVGMIAPNTQTTDVSDAVTGTLQITNCVNSGSLQYTGSVAQSKELHMGGIVGFSGWLGNVTATTADPYPNLIENCYNLYPIKAANIMQNSTNDWIAGLVAKGNVTSGASQSSLWIKDSASVAVETQDQNGLGTNEYRNVNLVSAFGYYGVQPVRTSGVSTVQTLTAAEMIPAVSDIYAEIAAYRDAATGKTVHKWLAGTGAPAGTAGAGDLYLDTESGKLYLYDQSWSLIANFNDKNGLVGNGAPEIAGTNGMVYMDQDTATLYLYNDGWIALSDLNHSANHFNKNEREHWLECSCGEKYDVQPHTFSTSKSDDTHHWAECECGQIANAAAHSFDTVQKDAAYHWAECSCGAVSGHGIHSFTVYQKDSAYHWSECSCGIRLAAKAHSYTAKFNETYHWQECVCGLTAQKAQHQFSWVIDRAPTEDLAGVRHEECSCGAIRNSGTEITKLPHSHNYGPWQPYNETQHQRVCNLNTAHVEYENHTFAEGICTACGAERPKPEPAPMPFIDVGEEDWFYSYVEYVYYEGLMNGVTTTTFVPDGTMTRAMVVTVLYRMSGSPAVTGSAGFSDVEADQWYAEEVNWAAQNGIVNGVGNNMFAPEKTITRQEFVTMLFRYAQKNSMDTSARDNLSTFADRGEVPDWSKAALQWAVAEEIISGMPEGNQLLIVPEGVASRAQAAAILMRYREN
ncbi:MAG: S-layer homology domain-containing protein [Clostridia bacterium]|nr:S-layer homology domain-containing protein [Clostridia bacterium]